ncbi:PT domain-containing protein [Plantactinospora endophytica]|uniref:Secreted protein n=1 Tax=Plantactinospora endophytica TaxID=673535 RepID=A0ABQ4E3I7_9ACTN|nr:PT domain-containing protein [Plantactinospora endophytica]GIG89268.1 hypothetical protein Pen02_42040 [Plantactinospora endophytica]
MDRTRNVARSLLPTATVLAATLTLAGLPAAHGTASAGPAVQKHLLDDVSPDAGERSAPPTARQSAAPGDRQRAAPTAGPSAAPGAVPSAAPPAVESAEAGGRSELLAKAMPDECFGGIGTPSPPQWQCEYGKPKVNQSYVWGLTKSGNHLWFGTAANVHCLTLGISLTEAKPIENDDYVCEYGESRQRATNPFIPPAAGDWRPPKVYLYDTSTRKLTDKTAAITTKSPLDRVRLESTVGIRAAGTHRGVVLLGGPGVLGINLFAFDAKSGRYLGSTTVAAYGTIRHIVVADGALYAGVGAGPDGLAGGAVLRWTGSKSSPFRFTVVAKLPAQVADLVVHKGRMFVTTWPSIGRGLKSSTIAGVWMSGWLTDGKRGLTASDAGSWRQVWSAAQYEPDKAVAASYGLGGLASYGGHLYWGTMHVPMKATQAHALRYRPASDEESSIAVQNTQRSTSVFRASNFDKGKAKAQLLYGAAELPAFDPDAKDGAGEWQLRPTGYKPKFGESGFGNSYNNYTWKMVVAGGSLYVGTMDWTYVGKDLPSTVSVPVQAGLGDAVPATSGADLWVFDNPKKPAKPVSTTGLGNYLNYGIRTIVADRSALYLGMANPMNLRTDREDDVPEGGWELIRLPLANPRSPATKR